MGLLTSLRGEVFILPQRRLPLFFVGLVLRLKFHDFCGEQLRLLRGFFRWQFGQFTLGPTEVIFRFERNDLGLSVCFQLCGQVDADYRVQTDHLLSFRVLGWLAAVSGSRGNVLLKLLGPLGGRGRLQVGWLLQFRRSLLFGLLSIHTHLP